MRLFVWCPLRSAGMAVVLAPWGPAGLLELRATVYTRPTAAGVSCRVVNDRGGVLFDAVCTTAGPASRRDSQDAVSRRVGADVASAVLPRSAAGLQCRVLWENSTGNSNRYQLVAREVINGVR